MGPIAGQWIKAQTKLEILTVIQTSQQQGVSVRRSCAILVIAHRRIVRWQHPMQGRFGPWGQVGQVQPVARLLSPRKQNERVLLGNRN